MIKFLSNSTQDTTDFAEQIAKKLSYPQTILLLGDMGSGKTTFTKSLIKFLGVKANVTSPTFNIVNQYSVLDKTINHFDMYRLEDESEAEEIGVVDMLKDKNSINIIEWPQKIKSLLSDNVIKIYIKQINENKREFLVEGLK